MAVSQNGRLAAVGQPDKGFRIYDASEGRELRELVFKALPEAESSSLAFSADARLVAYAKTGDTVSVQEAATGRELYSLNTGASKSPQRVRFGGGRLVTATDTGEGRGAVKLWDAATGQLVRDLAGAGTHGGLRVLSFSHDGRLLATVAPGSKAVRLTDIETGRDVRTLQTGTTDAGVLAAKAAFVKSIDPQTIAGLRERGITTPEQIIDAVEGLGAVANEKFQAGDAVSFSPDGRLLISRRMLLKNLTAEAWDMTTGTLVTAPDGAELRQATF
jgi:WD40 repeat protein